jgi:hypothetical protein
MRFFNIFVCLLINNQQIEPYSASDLDTSSQTSSSAFSKLNMLMFMVR